MSWAAQSVSSPLPVAQNAGGNLPPNVPPSAMPGLQQVWSFVQFAVPPSVGLRNAQKKPSAAVLVRSFGADPQSTFEPPSGSVPPSPSGVTLLSPFALSLPPLSTPGGGVAVVPLSVPHATMKPAATRVDALTRIANLRNRCCMTAP